MLIAVPIVPTAAALPVAVSAPAAAASVLVAGADGILRSRGEFRRPVLLMAASEAAGFAGLPVAMLTHSAIWTCLAISVGMSLGAVGAALALVRIRQAGRHPVLRRFARASLPLGLSQVLIAAGTFEGVWRVYQLSQYAAGGVASAAAPFIADALGSGSRDEVVRLLRKLSRQLLWIGIGGGVVLWFGREPIARILTGSLAGPVSEALLPLALVSPLAAVGLVSFYTLIGRDGQRRYVLAAHAIGAAVNITLAAALAPSAGVRGVVIGCAAGLTVTNVLLLVRFVSAIRDWRTEPGDHALAASSAGLGPGSP
jgi:Na+-driven multidrug efflux pump